MQKYSLTSNYTNLCTQLQNKFHVQKQMQIFFSFYTILSITDFTSTKCTDRSGQQASRGREYYICTNTVGVQIHAHIFILLWDFLLKYFHIYMHTHYIIYIYIYIYARTHTFYIYIYIYIYVCMQIKIFCYGIMIFLPLF